MLFANMGINVELKTVSSLQDKHVEFSCQTLTDIQMKDLELLRWNQYPLLMGLCMIRQ